MVLYGLGTILGAGIYVLTGVVAAEAGQHAPLSFFLAALVAAPTAYSYSVLAADYPKSAGEAVYVDAAFQRQWLARLVGGLVVLVGIISAATISRGFVGYLQVFVELPASWIILALALSLTALAIYGVLESVTFAATIAVLEIGGLMIVVGGGIAQTEYQDISLIPNGDMIVWSGIMAGTVLAFYAFIGFEDIVNMAEETRTPTKTIPLAILISLAAASLLYFLVTYIAVLTVPLDQLANAAAPMALVVEHHGTVSPRFIAMISMLAVVNGALVQIIMASRVVYGVARMRNETSWLAHISASRRTPINATLVVGGAVLIVALFFDLKLLATFTSITTLSIFIAVNLALCKLQGRVKKPAHLIPWFALLVSTLLLASASKLF